MFNGVNLAYKGLSLIPALLGPVLGAVVAASAYKGFLRKKKEEKVEVAVE